MDAEVVDHKMLPSRPKPRAYDPPMTERARQAIRKHREEVEAAELAEREAADAPIRKAKADREASERRFHEFMREQLTTGVDGQFVLDPETINPPTPIPRDKVDDYNQTESRKFLAANPDYFKCPENFAMLTGYIQRNAPNAILVSAKQYQQAFERLRRFGLMRERPKVVTIQQPKPASQKPIASAPKPELLVGRDYATGLERTFTKREVERMSSTDYKRAFGTLETVAELLTAMSQANHS